MCAYWMVAGLLPQLEVFWNAFSQQVVLVTTPFWWKRGGVDQLNWFCACGPICEAKKKSIMKVSITNTYLDGNLNAQGSVSELATCHEQGGTI